VTSLRNVTPRTRALAILVLAAGVRILYVIPIWDTGCLAINGDPISDMETFHRWALRIVEGDWLGREDFHPYHPWQRGIAPEKTWLEWYGPRVFHQDPLYPYALAMVYLVAPRRPESVIAVQLFLGSLAAAGVYLLARRLGGERAALAAGILAALYGPFLFYESLLLRDTLLVALTTGFLLCLEEARGRAGWKWWAGAGALAGATYLTKSNIALFLPLLALWICFGGEVKERAGTLLAVAAGFSAALLPAVARNVAVGAPALRTTTRGAIEFINGNNPYHVGIGWFDGDDARVTGYAREVLSRSRARLLPTVAEVAGTWRGRLGGLVWLQIKKLGYFLAPFEMPNNASYAYFRSNSHVLRWGLPTFYTVAPLAVLGLFISLGDWRRFLPHYLFLAAGIAATVAFYVIARFRIPYLIPVLVLAGRGAAGLMDLLERRRWAALGASAGLVAALIAANTAVNYPDLDLVRPQDYVIAAEAYALRGESRRAAEELDRGRGVFPAFTLLHTYAGRLRERAGDPRGALLAYRDALRLDPASREAAEAVERLQASGEAAP